MHDIEHARSLIRLAYRDLNALIGMADSPLFADEIFGFHTQQAVEKALKAWLSARDTIYPLTHELPRLLTMLEGIGAGIEGFWPLMRFTPYAVQARYEEGPASVDDFLDRAAGIAEVQALLRHVSTIIGGIGVGD
jgi:hypothetical protein